MNELIAQVSRKTGLSAEQAQGVIDLVVGYLKSRLPSPIVGQINSLLEDDGGSALGGAWPSQLFHK